MEHKRMELKRSILFILNFYLWINAKCIYASIMLNAMNNLLTPYVQKRSLPYLDTIVLKRKKKSSICGGLCCTNATEIELRKKATIEFERLLHHHTKSLRGILESTANWFQYILRSSLMSKKR
uniref:Uncharacterized protein n=1 Tax=Glossina austeni TaxID=7395 RepID=A0A1A9UP60_GLOAU